MSAFTCALLADVARRCIEDTTALPQRIADPPTSAAEELLRRRVYISSWTTHSGRNIAMNALR